MTTFAKDRELTVDAIAAAGAVGVIAGIAVILASVWVGFWMGLTLSVLWGWFIVPLFGLPALSIWQACAVLLVASVLRGWNPNKRDEKPKDFWFKVLLIPPFATGLYLVFGWFVKAWA